MGAWAGSGDRDFSLAQRSGIRPTAAASSIRTAAIPLRAMPLAQLGRGSQQSLFKPASEMDQSE
jgi:hypothetical protein